MNTDLALLVLRVAVGVVIMGHGLLKIGWVGKGGTLTGTAGWFGSIGLKPGMFWASIAVLAEAGGGFLTILGLGGPIGPGIVAADLVVVTLVAHLPKGFWAHEGGWEFPVPVAAGAFAIALIGNGRWSLDALLGLTYSDQLTLAWLAIMAVGAVLALVARALFAPKPKAA
ncbi:MAG TPA: DoxX family protein [Candidatus Limnocylindria bacterium]